MKYENNYGIRFTRDERQMLTEVARRVILKESDVLRVLVRGAFEALKQESEQESKVNTEAQ